MPTTFKQATSGSIGTHVVDVLTVNTGFTVTVIGCNLANITDYDTANVDVYVNGVDSVDITYIKGLTIPPNSAVKIITSENSADISPILHLFDSSLFPALPKT
jgi:hypothetical protein